VDRKEKKKEGAATNIRAYIEKTELLLGKRKKAGRKPKTTRRWGGNEWSRTF